MSHSLCSRHLSISLCSKKLGGKLKEGRLLVGWLVGWLGSCWQVVIGVIYHLWKGLRAHHTNHTSARCYSQSTARTYTHTNIKTHTNKQSDIQTHAESCHCYSQWNHVTCMCVNKKKWYIVLSFLQKNERHKIYSRKTDILNTKFNIRPAGQRECPLLNLTHLACRIRLWKTKHNDFPIELSAQTKEGSPPPRLWQTHADKREGHLTALAITATTSHVPPPTPLPTRGARHYEPTCQVPTCLSNVSQDAHRSSNSQLVWAKREFWTNTVMKPLKKQL